MYQHDWKIVDCEVQVKHQHKQNNFLIAVCFRCGIIGEPLSQYNAITLSPVGADNEDEDNEGEEGEQKQ